MRIDWIAESNQYADLIRKDREQLHRIPEIGNREVQTSAYIEAVLKELGIEVEHLLDTAIIGTLHGDGKGPVAALRADIDALPITEETGCSFSSTHDGFMHACGHDVHMASALGAARILSAHKGALNGTVKFIFQPDEEGNGGAKRLVDLGVLLGVDAVFGAHVSPDLPAGTLGVRYGKFYAASDVFRITITGKSCHGAEPQKGIDALYTAAEIISRLRKVPDECAPDRAVLSIGRFEAGTAVNIIAGTAEFEGIIRTLGPKNRSYVKARLREIIDAVCSETGAKADIYIRESYPGVVNTDTMTAIAEEAGLSLLGNDHVVRIEEPTMTTEDFGYYIDAGQGAFYHFGVGGDRALHNSGFLPDDDAPVFGAAVHAAVLTHFLNTIEE